MLHHSILASLVLLVTSNAVYSNTAYAPSRPKAAITFTDLKNNTSNGQGFEKSESSISKNKYVGLKTNQTESEYLTPDDITQPVEQFDLWSDMSEEYEDDEEDRFNGRYYFHDKYLTWNLAAQFCRGNNSHLAYPDTAEEAALLDEMMTTNGATQIHLGFHDMFGEGIYYTVTGQLITDTCNSKWGPGYPVGGSLYDCGGNIAGAGLLDQSCDDSWPFICEKYLWADYDLKPEMGHYKYHEDEVTWDVAVETCEREGANLLILQTEEEYTLLFEDYEFTWPWIGAHHILENKEYLTIFGDPLHTANFTLWSRDVVATVNNTVSPHVKLVYNDGYVSSYSEAGFICQHALV